VRSNIIDPKGNYSNSPVRVIVELFHILRCVWKSGGWHGGLQRNSGSLHEEVILNRSRLQNYSFYLHIYTLYLSAHHPTATGIKREGIFKPK
jgi:hypothetical protein